MKKLIKRIKTLIQSIIKQFAPNSLLSSPSSSRPSVPAIPAVSPRWESGLVFVCSQCATELPNRGATAAEELQNWLKTRLKFEGLWGEFRVVSTSCLGVCPNGRVAVIFRNRCLIVDPKSDRELLYSRIKQKNG
ncbi:MAG: hypothetical protein AB3A66_12585 [Nodularia sp. CChRGM 3473]